MLDRSWCPEDITFSVQRWNPPDCETQANIQQTFISKVWSTSKTIQTNNLWCEDDSLFHLRFLRLEWQLLDEIKCWRVKAKSSIASNKQYPSYKDFPYCLQNPKWRNLWFHCFTSKFLFLSPAFSQNQTFPKKRRNRTPCVSLIWRIAATLSKHLMRKQCWWMAGGNHTKTPNEQCKRSLNLSSDSFQSHSRTRDSNSM